MSLRLPNARWPLAAVNYAQVLWVFTESEAENAAVNLVGNDHAHFPMKVNKSVCLRDFLGFSAFEPRETFRPFFRSTAWDPTCLTIAICCACCMEGW